MPPNQYTYLYNSSHFVLPAYICNDRSGRIFSEKSNPSIWAEFTKYKTRDSKPDLVICMTKKVGPNIKQFGIQKRIISSFDVSMSVHIIQVKYACACNFQKTNFLLCKHISHKINFPKRKFFLPKNTIYFLKVHARLA